jgi:hypothetical protein
VNIYGNLYEVAAKAIFLLYSQLDESFYILCFLENEKERHLSIVKSNKANAGRLFRTFLHDG